MHFFVCVSCSYSCIDVGRISILSLFNCAENWQLHSRTHTKLGFFNEYLYIVPVANILSVCLESMFFTKGSFSMVHSFVVVLHCAAMRPQSFPSWLRSALPRKSPQVHFPNAHCQWFSSSTCRVLAALQHSSPLLPKARKLHFNWRLA